MTIEMMQIVLPEGMTPYEYSSCRPSLCKPDSGWHKSRGFLIPADCSDYVKPGCVFFLGEDGLWNAVWHTDNPNDRGYNESRYLNTVCSYIREGRMKIVSSGMDFHEFRDKIEKSYGANYDFFTIVTADDLYAEFGAKIIRPNIHALRYGGSSRDIQMRITL